MAEKKRKVAETSTVVTRPAKKSKKTAVTATAQPAVDKVTKDVPSSTTEQSKPAKKPRKRAADFLDDEAEATPPKKGKKGFKSKTEAPKLLTADGSNEVIEHSDDEGITITTSATPARESMMAEAVRTADQELGDEFGGPDDEDELDIDLAPALLTGFDSDNDDPAEDKSFDASRTAPIPQFKKTSKKLRQAASKTEEPGVVYVGRIPHGFYEKEMRDYFSQFGTITKLRLSRNKKTGASKHFAFIEFESNEVAKIVAETMDNYLMFGHILKCKLVDAEQLHPNTWQGANKRFRKIPHHKLAREREEKARQNLTPEKVEKKMDKEKKKREKKQRQMKELGYEYELPELKKPGTNDTPKSDEEVKAILPEAETPDVAGALIPPPTVPKDEVAAKIEEKVKKAKKEKKNAASAEEVAPKNKQKKSKAVAEEEQPAEKNVLTEEAPAEKSKKVKTTGDSGSTIKTGQTISDKKSLVKAAAKGKTEPIKPAKKEKQLKGILKKPKKA